MDTRWPWLILLVFGRGSVVLVRMTECGLIGRGSADAEGLVTWSRSAMI